MWIKLISPGVRRGLTGIACLCVAAFVWLPAMHLVFRPDLEEYVTSNGLAPKARQLAAHHGKLWTNPAPHSGEIARMRQSNAEWDFMARTYYVLALANMALRDPADEARYLALMDKVIEDTVGLEQTHGIHYFLMDYSRYHEFKGPTGRSVFQDGEIAMMLAARQYVRPNPAYVQPLRERVSLIVKTMEAGPILCGESYPDECWTFCNTLALAAVRLTDAVDGTDHSAFIDRWVASAKKHLVHPGTGLLVSSFTLEGDFQDGPEGSSIWMVAHCLQLLDPEFAEEQYRLARKALGRNALGFGYALEWPAARRGPTDIDSGPIVPFLEISPASSGLAILGAAAFGDHDFLAELLTSLEFGAFPQLKDGCLRYHASNPVGDAVLLYAMVQGRLWDAAGRIAPPTDKSTAGTPNAAGACRAPRISLNPEGGREVGRCSRAVQGGCRETATARASNRPTQLSHFCPHALPHGRRGSTALRGET